MIRSGRMFLGRVGVLLPVLLLASLLHAGVVLGAFSGSASATATYSSLLLVPPGSVTAASNAADGSCSSVLVEWTAASDATDYRVEVREGAGAWTTLVSSTGSRSAVDSAGHAPGTSVTYRVTSLHAPSGWQSANTTASTALTCP